MANAEMNGAAAAVLRVRRHVILASGWIMRGVPIDKEVNDVLDGLA